MKIKEALAEQYYNNKLVGSESNDFIAGYNKGVEMYVEAMMTVLPGLVGKGISIASDLCKEVGEKEVDEQEKA